MTYHPDRIKGVDDPEELERMKERFLDISKAYETLKSERGE